MRIGGGENASIARTVGIVGRYFSMLGVKAVRGRFFTDDEIAPPSVALVAVQVCAANWARTTIVTLLGSTRLQMSAAYWKM